MAGGRMLAVAGALWFLIIFIIGARAETRYGQGLISEDQSINSRLVVWKHFPEMLAAAPWGWGWGRAGDAYTQWFQPANESINFLNLLNSHFTWMAEGGWAFSIFYLAAWFVVLLLCWPSRDDNMQSVPLAVWTAFGVGGFFSQVEDTLWMWMAPVLLLAFVIYKKRRREAWPAWEMVGAIGLLSVCVVSLTIYIGWVSAKLPIMVNNEAVVLGHGTKTTVIYIDRHVMGKLYGHTLRKFLAERAGNQSEETYIVTEKPDCPMPADVCQIILSGRMALDVLVPSNLPAATQLILLGPA